VTGNTNGEPFLIDIKVSAELDGDLDQGGLSNDVPRRRLRPDHQSTIEVWP